MSNQQSLQNRVVAKIVYAEQLSVQIDRLHELEKIEPEQLLTLIPAWNEAAKQAIHFCRLARLALCPEELITLIDRLHALNPEQDLWEMYIVGEWDSEMGDLPE
jgi:hypothetical protein